MATLRLPLSVLTDGNRAATGAGDPPRDDYFQRKHHCPSSYSRIENWVQDVEQKTFPTELVRLSDCHARAILRYREETKLRAAVRDQMRSELGEKEQRAMEGSMEDPQFLDEMYEFIMKDWPQDGQAEVRQWHASLMELQEALDGAIRGIDQGHGTFVKLSIRSPKDASLNMTKTYDGVRARIRSSTLRLVDGKPTPETVSEDIAIMQQACAESLRARDGKHALRLLLESERAYTDLTAHMLYLEDGEPFNLQVAVREWCPDLNPDWEFRLFVMSEEPTALTIYNDFFYDEAIVHQKSAIEAMIVETWREVCDRIHLHTTSYCIDFAVTPDLQKVFIVEVNNFLPPLAGSGLFSFSDDLDRKLLDEGPFTFRVREAALHRHEQEVEGGVRTLHPPLRALMEAERSSKAREEAGSGCVVS